VAEIVVVLLSHSKQRLRWYLKADNSQFMIQLAECNLRWMFGKLGGKVWTALIWLRIRTTGGLLWTW